MGLDMTLYRKIWAHDRFKGYGDIDATLHFESNEPVTLNKVKFITIESAYWRKANHIHGWFIKNCADGIDDCREIPVTVNHLRDLLGVCREVQRNQSRAEELLPTVKGCFFGVYEYGECYFGHINFTISVLASILEAGDPHISDDSFIYRASW